MTRFLVQLSPLGAIAALAGCLGGAGASAPASFEPSLTPAAKLAPLARGDARIPRVVFVSDLAASVPFFSASVHQANPPALGSIALGVTRATGLFVDRNGVLYVSNNTWPPSIAEYKRGTVSPFKTITNGLFTPGSVAVDTNENLYVADGQQGGVILVYPPHATSPQRRIQVPRQGSHSVAGGLAFDPQGDLLVATFDVEHNFADVYSIAPGSSQANNLNLQGLPGSAIGTDKAGNLYVGGSGGTISVYAPGSKTPSRFINAGNSGFYSNLKVTPNGTIYWPNYDLGEMFEFAPGASAPTNVFEGGGGVDTAVGPK